MLKASISRATKLFVWLQFCVRAGQAAFGLTNHTNKNGLMWKCALPACPYTRVWKHASMGYTRGSGGMQKMLRISCPEMVFETVLMTINYHWNPMEMLGEGRKKACWSKFKMPAMIDQFTISLVQRKRKMAVCEKTGPRRPGCLYWPCVQWSMQGVMLSVCLSPRPTALANCKSSFWGTGRTTSTLQGMYG